MDWKRDLFPEQTGIFNLNGFFVHGNIPRRTDVPFDNPETIIIFVIGRPHGVARVGARARFETDRRRKMLTSHMFCFVPVHSVSFRAVDSITPGTESFDRSRFDSRCCTSILPPNAFFNRFAIASSYLLNLFQSMNIM